MQIDNLKFNINFKSINPLINYIRINSSYVLTVFKNIKTKFLVNIFKNNLVLLFSNNCVLLEISNLQSNHNILDYLVMICVNNCFINTKYFNNIKILYKILKNNFIIFLIFIIKIIYIINILFIIL
jgi:hypothetical protein